MLAASYGLIATMDPAHAEIVSHVVAGFGLEPIVTRDGADAEAKLRERGAPGLIVTELSLPRVDGFTLLAFLRALARADDWPAIVISAFADLRTAAEKLRGPLGIAAILPGSASPQLVQRAVKRALERDRFVAHEPAQLS